MYVYVLIYTYLYYRRSLFEPEPDDAKREFVTHLFLSVCALPRHTHALCVFFLGKAKWEEWSSCSSIDQLLRWIIKFKKRMEDKVEF